MDLQITRLRAPLSVQFELTYACNNYCLFCYNVWKHPSAAQDGYPSEVMSFERICAILDHLKETGVFQVHFTGGEPTLHPEFLNILKYAHELGLRPSFSTNGNLMTPDFVEQVSQIGAKQCQVSLHGSTAQLHESLTQVPGSFEKTIQGIRNLAEHGMHANVNMTVNRRNIHDIFETARLAKDLGATSFSFTRFVYSGAGHAQQATLGLNREDQNHLVDVLTRIEAELGFRNRILTPIPFCSLLEPEKIAGNMSKCDGGITWCVIGPSGQVRTCTNAEEIAGDLQVNTLEEIWRHSPAFDRCQNLEHIPEPCKQCEAFVYCGGGCRACAANASQGDHQAPDPCSNLTRVQNVNARFDRLKEAIVKRNRHKAHPNEAAPLSDDPKAMIPMRSGPLLVRQEEFGLLVSNGKNFVIVNEVGLEILRQIDGQRNLAEVVTYFAEQFPDIPQSEIQSQILSFIKSASLMKMVYWL